MGALTSNRKRGDECLSFSCAHPSPNLPNFQSSKRPRLSHVNQSPNQLIVSSKSASSRLSRYPDIKPPLPRVHAPCRTQKFGSFRGLSPKTRGVPEERSMGNVPSNRLDKAKNAAFDAFRYSSKDKEVIELDKEVEDDRVSEDSSIEEVVAIEEDDQEGPSVVDYGQELDTKMVDYGTQATHPSASSVVSDLTTTTNTAFKEDSAGKMLDSLTLNREAGVPSKAAYKLLIESVERRAPKLKYLDVQIDFHWKKRSMLESLRPQKKPVEVVPVEPFVPLRKEEVAEIEQAFSSSNRKRILVTHENSNIEIRGELLQCLRPGAWLKDEVINVYLELLKEREKREPQKFLKCHFFNTFFYTKLISGKGGYDYKSVRRWTTERKLGYYLIDCDKIFVPIHKEIHWCLAVINKVDQKLQYLDSLKGRDTQVMRILAKYYVDEVKDKSGEDIDLSSWELEYVDNLPEQENGYDCGVFMVKYADFYSRDIGLCFKQEHMPYFRLRTAKEILKLRAD
ncbi:ubiquitin-like-specific protease ESD4 [Pyrus x bretschneideri]|uniref:ubiquitin-like-specific protease ESD4 n=1 Tax=Pyrus x bretschneideri TaxID=225117 RepID=UPI00202E75B7|nr:ubiquitin-like-specific protease ESD4 [Pyrus x bretschneideri]